MATGQSIAFLPASPSPSSRGDYLLVQNPLPELENLTYVKAKGRRASPDEICGELIGIYFQHFHPAMPVIDASVSSSAHCSVKSELKNFIPYGFWVLFLKTLGDIATIFPIYAIY